MTDRRRARELYAEAVAAGRPTAWFDALYREAAEGTAVVPWADLAPSPHLVSWLDRERPAPGRALDVGCGYGDNAAELARRGFEVTAFDVSSTAIAHARARFGDLARFEVADAAAPPPEWHGAFGLVVEIYTLQALPASHRAAVARGLVACLAPGGTLLVVCRGRDEGEPAGDAPPFALSRAELASIGLEFREFEDFLDAEEPPARRFRAALGR